MAKFIVLGNLTHDGKNYTKGKTVEMAPELAAAIPWAVQPVEVKDPDPEGGDESKPKRKK
jgi:hypothetical protein